MTPAGIDVTVRSAVLDILVHLQKQRAFSALIVTADLAEVRRVSTQVMIMHGGIFVGLGQVEEVLADPRHPYVAGLASIARPSAGRRMTRRTPGEHRDLVAPSAAPLRTPPARPDRDPPRTACVLRRRGGVSGRCRGAISDETRGLILARAG